mgnify:CR=1 FL=1
MPQIYIDPWTGVFFAGLIVLIGVVATLKNLRSACGPKERAFVARGNLAAWVTCLCFFAAWYFTPHPYSYLLLLAYFAVFPMAVYRFCSKRLLIRRLERIHPAVEANGGNGAGRVARAGGES